MHLHINKGKKRYIYILQLIAKNIFAIIFNGIKYGFFHFLSDETYYLYSNLKIIINLNFHSLKAVATYIFMHHYANIFLQLNPIISICLIKF